MRMPLWLIDRTCPLGRTLALPPPLRETVLPGGIRLPTSVRLAIVFGRPAGTSVWPVMPVLPAPRLLAFAPPGPRLFVLLPPSDSDRFVCPLGPRLFVPPHAPDCWVPLGLPPGCGPGVACGLLGAGVLGADARGAGVYARGAGAEARGAGVFARGAGAEGRGAEGRGAEGRGADARGAGADARCAGAFPLFGGEATALAARRTSNTDHFGTVFFPGLLEFMIAPVG